MIQPIIENERYLTTEYVKRTGIRLQNVTAVGSHPLTCRLRELGNISVFRSLCEKDAADGALWYVLDTAENDLGELKDAVKLCRKKDLSLLCIILIKNIKNSPTIRQYSEMELLTVDEQLDEIRAVLSKASDVKAVVLDRLIGAQFDGVGLSEILKGAEAGTITVTQDMAQRYFSALYLPDALSAILTVAEKGKTDPLFAKLDACVKAHKGLWNAEAEKILLSALA